MTVQTLDQPAVEQLIILRGGMVEIVKQIKLSGINLRVVLQEEDFSLPFVADVLCLFESFFMVSPVSPVYQYCQATGRFGISDLRLCPPSGGFVICELRGPGLINRRLQILWKRFNLPLIMSVEETLHLSGSSLPCS